MGRCNVGKQPLRIFWRPCPISYILTVLIRVMARRKKSRSRRKGLPHPSLTSLMGGLIIGNRINEGADPKSTITGALMKGQFDVAINRFLVYTPAMVTSSAGQTALVKGIGVAVLGSAVRKALPNVKLGGSKIYARI